MDPPKPHVIDRSLVLVDLIPTHKIISKSDMENLYDVPMTQLNDILPTPSNYEEASFHDDPWCKD
jgi:hypothetical protein